VLEFQDQSAVYDYARVLDEIAETGYSGTELGDWGFMPTEPVTLRAELEARRLALLGAFVPVQFANRQAHEEGEQQARRTAALLRQVAGTSAFIVLADDTGGNPARAAIAGRVGPQDVLSPSDWDVVAEGAQRIARSVRDAAGLRTVFHPHCASFVETGNEVGELMERTDPGLLGLCLDTGHLTFGGSDPRAVFEAFSSRVWHVHFKDCDPKIAARARAERWDYFQAVRHGVFCELGKGTVDFRGVIDGLWTHGYAGWVVVEQDVLPTLGTPAESARRNREFLRGLGL
jgi:inosose dehydratase